MCTISQNGCTASLSKTTRKFFFLIRNVKILISENKDALVFEPYLRAYEDLLALNDKVATYVPLSKELISRSTNVPLLSSLIRGVSALVGLDSAVQARNPSDNQLIQSYLDRSDYSGPAGPQSSAAVAKSASSQPPSTMPPAAPPVASVAEIQSGDDTGHLMDERDDGLKMLSKKKAQLEKFLFISGIDASFASSILSVQIYECQRVVALLGFLVLPALYGLLGTTMFQMRAILNPLVPDPSPERLFVRLALGAFAGISIFLVFGPTPQKIFEGTSTVIGSFGLAFLLGFSIDGFFSILDRLVGAVSQFLAQPAK